MAGIKLNSRGVVSVPRVDGYFANRDFELARAAMTPEGQAMTAARIESWEASQARRAEAATQAAVVVAAEVAVAAAPSLPPSGESYLA